MWIGMAVPIVYPAPLSYMRWTIGDKAVTFPILGETVVIPYGEVAAVFASEDRERGTGTAYILVRSYTSLGICLWRLYYIAVTGGNTTSPHFSSDGGYYINSIEGLDGTAVGGRLLHTRTGTSIVLTLQVRGTSTTVQRTIDVMRVLNGTDGGPE